MYDLHTLGWHSFQQLCLTITREILGQTVEAFLDSSDAGKDGAFAGTWKPANAEALTGRFVIQCKFSTKRDKKEPTVRLPMPTGACGGDTPPWSARTSRAHPGYLV